jgi:hypothetical protein
MCTLPNVAFHHSGSDLTVEVGVGIQRGAVGAASMFVLCLRAQVLNFTASMDAFGDAGSRDRRAPGGAFPWVALDMAVSCAVEPGLGSVRQGGQP